MKRSLHRTAIVAAALALAACAVPGDAFAPRAPIASDLVAHGYPVYPSFDRASMALSRVADYWANRIER